jgi:hypothetical protein
MSAMAAKVGGSVTEVRDGAAGGGGELPTPCNTTAPPPWILLEAGRSRSCTMDLDGVGEMDAESAGIRGSRWGRTERS